MSDGKIYSVQIVPVGIDINDDLRDFIRTVLEKFEKRSFYTFNKIPNILDIYKLLDKALDHFYNNTMHEMVIREYRAHEILHVSLFEHINYTISYEIYESDKMHHILDVQKKYIVEVPEDDDCGTDLYVENVYPDMLTVGDFKDCLLEHFKTVKFKTYQTGLVI